jgi:dTDP-4-amino-4,6-dideoxygalactose transaminase
MIDFNKPYLTGKEIHYMYQAVYSCHISGNGIFTKKCQSFFEDRYKFAKCFLTSSCTDALEMAAILLNIKEGDEVIIPSYAFVSTANAFVLRGAKIVFTDSLPQNPNMDISLIEPLITKNTKVIVALHYAGIACDMDAIMKLADKYNLFVVEDAAQAIDSYYKGKPLGSFGHLATFSFHETKNIISGEGGMLVVNDTQFINRAEIIREKGTNRAEFFRGEVDKYNWIDVGSSFLLSDIMAGFLYAQLENIEDIQRKRLLEWSIYYEGLISLEKKGIIQLPHIPDFSSNNGHIFYIVCKSQNERIQLIMYLKKNNINAVFHYLSLHSSPYYAQKHDGREMQYSDLYSNCLLRLPMYYELTANEQEVVINKIKSFYLKYHKKQNQ